MAVYNIFISDDSVIGIWRIEESEEEMRSILGEDIACRVDQFKSNRRKREWLATRLLLNRVQSKCEPQEDTSSTMHQSDGCRDTLWSNRLKYYDSGAPYIENSTYNISITHGAEFAAVVVSEKSCVGIDIEDTRRDIQRVSNRFLSVNESETVSRLTDSSRQNRLLFLHWCGKEAIFKIIPESDIDFALQIELIFEPEKDSKKYRVPTIFRPNCGEERNYFIQYVEIENYMLAWVLK